MPLAFIACAVFGIIDVAYCVRDVDRDNSIQCGAWVPALTSAGKPFDRLAQQSHPKQGHRARHPAYTSNRGKVSRYGAHTLYKF